MAKQQIAADSLSVRTLGEWIGQAIGEGIAQGAQHAMGESAGALQPLVDEIVNALRQEMVAAQLAQMAEAALVAHDSEHEEEDHAEIARAETTRPCIEEGCTQSAVSRNLCQRHYARKLYQERKERLGAHGFRVVQPRATGAFDRGEPVVEKKPMIAAVAPIVRRKRADVVEAPAPVAAAAPAAGPATPAFKMPGFDFTPNPIAAAAAKQGVTPESVARALGLVKD